MEMVGHEDPFVQVDVRILLRQPLPAPGSVIPPFVPAHLTLHGVAEQMLFGLRANGYVIASGLGIIVSPQARSNGDDGSQDRMAWAFHVGRFANRPYVAANLSPQANGTAVMDLRVICH